MKQAWHVVEPRAPFVDNWHIQAICDHLQAISEGKLHDLLINIPPRHMKSLLVSVFWPAWDWIDSPQLKWLFTAYSGTLSLRDTIRCRRLIDSEWYQDNFGDKYQLLGDSKIRYETDKGGHRIPTSVDGTGTGEGGDRVVVDDPHNVRQAESDVVRGGVIDYWDQVLSSRLNDPKTGAYVIIMQRVHWADLAGHILDQGGFTHLMLPARYEAERKCITIIGDYRFEDPRTQEGELLWPQRFGEQEIQKMEVKLGTYGAAGQLQQRPTPIEGGLIKREWWRFHNGYDPAEFDMIIQSWDCAFKDIDTSSFVVGQVWGKKGIKKVLLDQARARMSFTGTLKAIAAMCIKWPTYNGVLVEDKANGTAVIDTLKEKVRGIIPIEPDGGKIARIEAAAPQYEAGNIEIPNPELNPWVKDYMTELESVPFGEFWDQADASSQAIRWMDRHGVFDESDVFFVGNYSAQKELA